MLRAPAKICQARKLSRDLLAQEVHQPAVASVQDRLTGSLRSKAEREREREDKEKVAWTCVVPKHQNFGIFQNIETEPIMKYLFLKSTHTLTKIIQ